MFHNFYEFFRIINKSINFQFCTASINLIMKFCFSFLYFLMNYDIYLPFVNNDKKGEERNEFYKYCH